MTARVIDVDVLELLVGALRARGFRVVGPTVANGAIAYAEIEHAGELPIGWTDAQEAGTYRLERRDDDARFGYAVGPHSWKPLFFAPRSRLVAATADAAGGFATDDATEERPPVALFGVRSCDLHAIGIQDRVFTGGAHVDPDYASRREGTFVVAVNCGQSGNTCFCVSMGTGPRAEAGYDIALTELLGPPHRFLLEVGTAAGAEVAAELPSREAGDADVAAGDAAVERARSTQGRRMPDTDLRTLLLENLEHPRWDDVAERCLSCANCTMVCPTCFCSSVEEATTVDGGRAERWRTWDSCFAHEHSFIHGGSVRPTTRSQYRQWMTHKLATWFDQFGSSGCVGCGRCITWCPVGIDITEEVAAIHATQEAAHADA